MKRIFEKLGVPERKILHSTPLEDFGHLPSDPNPVTCKDYVTLLREREYQFSAMISPDGVSYIMHYSSILRIYL